MEADLVSIGNHIESEMAQRPKNLHTGRKVMIFLSFLDISPLAIAPARHKTLHRSILDQRLAAVHR